MDSTQLLLTIILTVSTILAIIIGIQLIFVLKELRKALLNVNKVVSGLESVSVGIENEFSEVLGFVKGLRNIFKIIDNLNRKKNEK
ncbi:hypothetical protein AUK04_05120 [Candidatus Roizmanbacteria bacterium CG2_30_33_16]|uniref:DUF948 domain-containing protein n=4 Tax=Candidatus Roizmaniibacteriota TaxID=1752723 RepID=A0A2H0C2L9_9BACT|nr:hypothetical protein [Candidatus Roizmanbacteria bacterium]OIP82179.1 MAG: hypothetical protein AUK04_05120 [Candidatus Roizmanbacteria bacterium CG2_30_33_16]PIP64152.1 MAG: hypothetical protein COW96_04100 [Candidatus Roizmanbacteria bacterium CG22_combo_CG10-13_8_21_14_all_33_16]PIX70623.1 MAG: hypothetical protein COZ39_04440 [Candidatus Roizmanbacteria bacterium CG_4_10_14_3_um_filter_33_21]PJB87894.1 MAG: hypothetical protein CO083_04590 [Candidatus Roizmanbacteria bacterium CG_4_9_14_